MPQETVPAREVCHRGGVPPETGAAETGVAETGIARAGAGAGADRDRDRVRVRGGGRRANAARAECRKGRMPQGPNAAGVYRVVCTYFSRLL